MHVNVALGIRQTLHYLHMTATKRESITVIIGILYNSPELRRLGPELR